MTTTVIDVPYPPGYGLSVDVSQPVDNKRSITIGSGGNTWIATSGGNYYFDITHGFDTTEIVHEAYKTVSEGGGYNTVYPDVKRLNSNTVRVFWNSNESIHILLLRIATGY